MSRKICTWIAVVSAAFFIALPAHAQTIRIKDLPTVTDPTAGDKLPIDGTTLRGITFENLFKSNLLAVRGLSASANKLPYFTSGTTAALADFTSFARTLLDDTDDATARATLGVTIGTNVQAWDADLDCVAALSTTGLIRRTGAGTCSAGTVVAASEGGFGSDISAQSGVPLFSAGVPTFISTTGTGNFARAVSPSFTTPSLGAATATSVVASVSLEANGANPQIISHFSSGGTDQKRWDFQAGNLILEGRAINDAANAAVSWLQVNRGAGTAISSVVLPQGTLGLGTAASSKPGLLVLYGSTSGQVNIAPPAVGGSPATMTLPNATDTLVGRATTDTLTNKTLTSPVINAPTGIVKADVGLGNVDNTSDATKNAATAALTNKDVTSGTNTFPTFNQNTTGSAAKLTTPRNIDGQAFDGTAAITVVAPGTHAAPGKTTPVDADEVPLVDSASSNTLARLTWANLKATLKTYFDALTTTLSNKTLASAIFTGTADIQQAITLSGDITPAQITTSQNDYAPTGFSTAAVVRLSTDASRNITGLAGGSDGKRVYVYNAGSFNAVLQSENASSTAANRFGFSGDVTLNGSQGITLLYDSTASRWRMVGSNPSAGGGGGSGDASGPASAVNNNVALFDGTTGKLIKDGGYSAANLSGAFGFRNRVINPSGKIWQRANSGAAAITDVTYAFDRWYGLTQSNGVTASQVSNAENSTPDMMRLSQANATAQRFGIAQAIESANAVDLRGQSITLSARVRMSASTTLRYAIIEWTGTADSVTKDVVNDWTSGTFTTGNFFISTTTTIASNGSTALTANTLTSISLTGTVSSSANNIAVFFWTDSTQAQNVTFDIGKVQLEQGSQATPLAMRDNQQETQLCYRYYWTEGNGSGDVLVRTNNYSSGTAAAGATIYLPAVMFKSPSLSASGDISDGATFTTWSALVIASDKYRAVYAYKTGVPSGQFLDVSKLTADAEL